MGLILFSGGEGGNEILPLIDYEAIRQTPKRMTSYSDGTTILNAVWAMTGLETYYGGCPRCFDGGISDYDRWHFEHHLVLDDAKEHLASAPWQVATEGVAEGVLVGGYARNFAMLLGSRYFPCSLKEKHILFLEDHEVFGGIDYVSAMLSHIEQSDFMETVTGVLFGHYSDKPQRSSWQGSAAWAKSGVFPWHTAMTLVTESATLSCPSGEGLCWIRKGASCATCKMYLVL